MADITPKVPQGRQLIQSYGAGAFRIGGTVYTSSMLVLPEETAAWPATSYEEITVSSLNLFLAGDTGIEVLLIGCGARMGMPKADIRDALKAVSIVPEWMDTGAACRTFNVLLAEDRAVAAALIAVE